MIFNATVCIIGCVILLVHIANTALKKDKRRDEKFLLAFFCFTAFHFAAYFAFTVIKYFYTSDPLIMSFYTGFYIANNLEVFLLFLYMMAFVDVPRKARKPLQITNVSLFAVFVVLDLVNIFTHIFFRAEGGVYVRAGTMIFSQFYQFILLAIVFVVTASNKKLNRREKIAFGLYCFLPLVAIILQNFFKGYAIAYLSIIVAIEILFFFLNAEKNLELAKEEEKNKDAQIRIMLSQIQPHFIYNSLSSISTLIPIDPEKAQKALDDFTEYLRLNLSSLTANRLIPFTEELRHIKTFLSLEKIRFTDRINVVYDLQVTDFDVPPLGIQPLVENAVKHGILQKIEGGTVTLRSYETKSSYVVEVVDDGVGFDMEDVDFKNNTHVGLTNIRYRISTTGRGELYIHSVPGEGTKAVAIFKKEGETHEHLAG